MGADDVNTAGATAYQPFFIDGPMETARDVARQLVRLARAVLAGTVDPQRAAVAREALVRARDMLVESARERRQHPERYIVVPEDTRFPTEAEAQYMRETGRVPPGTRPAVENFLLAGPVWEPQAAPPSSTPDRVAKPALV